MRTRQVAERRGERARAAPEASEGIRSTRTASEMSEVERHGATDDRDDDHDDARLDARLLLLRSSPPPPVPRHRPASCPPPPSCSLDFDACRRPAPAHPHHAARRPARGGHYRRLPLFMSVEPHPLTRGDVLSTAEVAKLLGIPRSTAHELARRGQLPARRVGRRWLFLRYRIASAVTPLDGPTAWRPARGGTPGTA